jgi:adenine-specific DNA-methyltransferase
MTTKQNPKFQELVAKLREIFQIDRPELDFGIYRILNARAGEINDYLQNRLAEKVQAALSAGSAASAEQLQAELQEAEKNAQALGVSPDTVPKVQELRAKLKEASAGSSEHENAVFSHLLAFFSRYYEQGDFISQRRYKGDTYAIPYAGEEVMLHWANKDQYYTKSGENFSNYSFKLEDGRTVHFRLAAADTAKDNRKDNDKERRFALVTAKTVTRMDENGDEYEEELVPIRGGSIGKARRQRS